MYKNITSAKSVNTQTNILDLLTMIDVERKGAGCCEVLAKAHLATK